MSSIQMIYHWNVQLDELLNDGETNLVTHGYDHTGKKLKGKPSFDDFFNAKDDYGNLKTLDI